MNKSPDLVPEFQCNVDHQITYFVYTLTLNNTWTKIDTNTISTVHMANWGELYLVRKKYI